MRFPYQRYEVLPSATVPNGVLYRPELPVRLIGRIGAVSVLALADTGADETLLPRSLGEMIGAEIDATQSWSVSGIGGHGLAVVAAELEFEVISRRAVHRWRAKVGLVDFPQAEGEVAVLGHIGFFDQFTGHFNTRRRQVTIRLHR